ncbi:uncharacterized protein LOC132193609 isoform X2 [Neocloeon triangulifer]|nr:uncharacterized protein LOC132193609 isoform X2 [Neocloeon triangulifer]
MPISFTLDTAIAHGSALGSPHGPARLGFFETEEGEKNADNVFVFVAHYDFKGGTDDSPRPGDEKDVQNLRETFEEKRNCRFREWLSPKKKDLLDLLADGQILKQYFSSEEQAPSVFVLYILSHGKEKGVISTDTPHLSDQYETFNAKEVFHALKETFPGSLKLVFLGPCRGSLVDEVFKPDDVRQFPNENSSRVLLEPKLPNLVIFYSTVETTKSNRDGGGTWMVKFSCEQLNEMRKSESVVKFLTGVQNRIHLKTRMTFCGEGQTPEFKIYSQDRKFTFSCLDNGKIAASFPQTGADSKGINRSTENDQSDEHRSINYNWQNKKAILRHRRALIFKQGSKNNDVIQNLDRALENKLGFETMLVEIDEARLNHYFSKSKSVCWDDYGCFASFIFAELIELKDGEVCVRLNENVNKPIGELIHGLLGPKNDGWIGKPKLFFLVDTKYMASDSNTITQTTELYNWDKLIQATNHSGWLVFILQDKNIIQAFLKVFECKEITIERSLQELLSDLLVRSNCGDGSKAMLVSTLPYLLSFPVLERHFIEPYFELTDFENSEFIKISYEIFMEHASHLKENKIWLLSSVPGSGKSTVMREIAFDLQRKLEGGFKVYTVSLIHTYELFSAAKINNREAPSLAFIVSHETGIRKEDIQNLIEEKKIIVMFDGFDEICPEHRQQVLNLFVETKVSNVPMWISTRPNEEGAILKKIGRVKSAKICHLEYFQQIQLFKMISKNDEDACERQIKFYIDNGSGDILGNPLHLKLISEITDQEFESVLNLYDIYEKIVDKKMRFALGRFNEKNPLFMDTLYKRVKQLKEFSAEFLLLNGKSSRTLKPKNNGIVMVFNENVQFVHQSFMEFLAASHYIDWVKKNKDMPFNLFTVGFQQVRRFVEVKISSLKLDDDPDFFKILKKNIYSSLHLQIIIEENLPTMFKIVQEQVTFGTTERQGIFHCADSNAMFEKACDKSEVIALELLDLGAFETLKEPHIAGIEILASVIRNNFVKLFSALKEKCLQYDLPLRDLARESKKIQSEVTIIASRNLNELLRLVLDEGLFDTRFEPIVLKYAVFNNSVECVDLLIEHGAQTDSSFHNEEFIDNTRYSDLKVETVKALLKTKTEPTENLVAKIFRISMKYIYFAVAKFLHATYHELYPGAFAVDVEVLHDVSKETEILKFSTATAMCRWLVENFSLGVNDEDANGLKAFQHAVIVGNLELVQYFLERDNNLIKSLTDAGENVMHLAFADHSNSVMSVTLSPTGKIILESSRKKLIEYLHKLDKDLIKQKTQSNQMVLHFAVRAKNLDLLIFLVTEGVDLYAIDDRRWNAAHYAVDTFFFSLSQTLIHYLQKKAPELIKQRTKDGKTVLHIAAANCLATDRVKDKAAYEMLVAGGLDLRAEDSDGWNAIHIAAKEKNTELVKILVDFDPELITSVTKEGENVLHLYPELYNLSKEFKYLHLMNDLIMQKTKANKTVLHCAAAKGIFAACKWLVDKMGVEIDLVDNNGWNALHFSSFSDSMALEIVQFLHEKTPELIHTKTNRNENALHLAAKQKNFKLFEWLLENGVDDLVQDVDGQTPHQLLI